MTESLGPGVKREGADALVRAILAASRDKTVAVRDAGSALLVAAAQVGVRWRSAMFKRLQGCGSGQGWRAWTRKECCTGQATTCLSQDRSKKEYTMFYAQCAKGAITLWGRLLEPCLPTATGSHNLHAAQVVPHDSLLAAQNGLPAGDKKAAGELFAKLAGGGLGEGPCGYAAPSAAGPAAMMTSAAAGRQAKPAAGAARLPGAFEPQPKAPEPMEAAILVPQTQAREERARRVSRWLRCGWGLRRIHGLCVRRHGRPAPAVPPPPCSLAPTHPFCSSQFRPRSLRYEGLSPDEPELLEKEFQGVASPEFR